MTAEERVVRLAGDFKSRGEAVYCLREDFRVIRTDNGAAKAPTGPFLSS